MTLAVLRGTLILALVSGGCSGAGAGERAPVGAEPATRAVVTAARECVSDSAGPWTSECSARWVRRIIRRSGYRVTGTTGSAWVAAGGGREFFVWATERSGGVELSAEREGYRLAGRVAGAPVYDDGVRKFWPARGFVIWLAAGPRGDSIAPRASELASIIRASRTIPPPRPGGTR